MSRTTLVIVLLDKAWPPQHSFVDGMLAGEVARETDIRVRLCVSRQEKADSRPRRYLGAACMPLLHRRRGVGRILNLWAALKLIRYQADREHRRGHRVVLFVRNDPICLLAASLMRGSVDRLVFQSSFPHEDYSGGTAKRIFAKLLYRIGGRSVDAVTGVSPLGIKRIAKYCPSARRGPYIPLLSDLPTPSTPQGSFTGPGQGLRFLYIGSHSGGRNMNAVIRAVVRALNSGARGSFRFVGAEQCEIESLLSVKGVSPWLEHGRIALERPVPRSRIPAILAEADVGISLIPPLPVYIESSPTKLAEYLGAGLIVLASRGIPLQEEVVQSSQAGTLVDWSIEGMAAGILALEALTKAEVLTMRVSAIKFANKHLSYQNYIYDFRCLIFDPPPSFSWTNE